MLANINLIRLISGIVCAAALFLWVFDWLREIERTARRRRNRPVIRRQGGMGDADTALQEDRGTDTTAGDRGGKTVKQRTRPPLSPGQDGRKITEKGWANNGPPLEVP